MTDNSRPIALRDWPLPVRLVLAVFLLSAGLGYLSALVQLHFQSAAPGKPLPGVDEAVSHYYGEARKSQLGRLLEADVSKPFNGSGTMRPAFTTQSAGWTLVMAGMPLLDPQSEGTSTLERLLASPREDQAREKHEPHRPVEKILKEIDRDPFCGAGSMRAAFFQKSRGQRRGEFDKQLYEQRDAERWVLLAWVRKAGRTDEASMKEIKESFANDWYPLTGPLADVPVGDFIKEKDQDGAKTKGVEIASLFDVRCAVCHGRSKPKENKGNEKDFPMAELDQILPYCVKPEPSGTRDDPTVKAHAEIMAQRDGERLALISWIGQGAPRVDYEQDRHELKDGFEKHEITPRFLETDREGKRYAHIQSILEARCVRCHNADAGGAPAQYPLDSYDRLKPYTVAEKSTGMSLPKLAQTTHVHLLGFSMLFALTGLIFSMTSYPLFLRVIFGPFTLLAQIVDISCWWLGRADPNLARVIALTGGLVAMGLMIQIVGSLFNMFRTKGKIVVAIVLLLGVGLIGVLFVTVVAKQLKSEAGDATTAAARE
jgi:mono/diheme cytochrome c family protein